MKLIEFRCAWNVENRVEKSKKMWKTSLLQCIEWAFAKSGGLCFDILSDDILPTG